jgi:hypothetical protein
MFQVLHSNLGAAALFGCFFSLASIAVMGGIRYGTQPFTWDSWWDGVWIGVQEYFYLSYQFEPFVMALVASLAGVFIYVLLEMCVMALMRTVYRTASDKPIPSWLRRREGPAFVPPPVSCEDSSPCLVDEENGADAASSHSSSSVPSSVSSLKKTYKR